MLYEIRFDINPRSASRPRFTKSGHTYLAGPYKEFRKEMDVLCEDLLGDFDPLEGPLSVSTKLFVTRPQTTKLYAPKSDIDNYLKALFDALNAKAFEDDKQIVIVHARKSWTPSNEDEGYIKVSIEETS